MCITDWVTLIFICTTGGQLLVAASVSHARLCGIAGQNYTIPVKSLIITNHVYLIQKWCSVCDNCGLVLPYEFVLLNLCISTDSLEVSMISLYDICTFFFSYRGEIFRHTCAHTHNHASLHRPAPLGLTYECCPLAPPQLKGFAPSPADFKDANQHYLLGRMKWVKRFTLWLTELDNDREIAPKKNPNVTSLKLSEARFHKAGEIKSIKRSDWNSHYTHELRRWSNYMNWLLSIVLNIHTHLSCVCGNSGSDQVLQALLVQLYSLSSNNYTCPFMQQICSLHGQRKYNIYIIF